MYHLVYKIINITNGMYYYGVHSTCNIEDGYMGSGTYLKKAIAKHGVGSFERNIIHFCDSREEALKIEEGIVNLELLKDKNCYNLVVGGMNGVRSVKSKRELFARNARAVKVMPFEKYNENYKVVFKPKVEYKLVPSDKYDCYRKEMYSILLSTKIFDIATEVCNNKFTHHLTDKYLNLINKVSIWQNNIEIEKVSW